jgi:hypothetical protein
MPADLSSGLCASADAEIWFSDDEEDRKAAILICRRCPVTEACRRDAVDRGERWGVWGGVVFTRKRAPRPSTPVPLAGPLDVRHGVVARVDHLMRDEQITELDEMARRLGCKPVSLRDMLRRQGEPGRALIRALDPDYTPMSEISARSVASLARNGRRSPAQNARRRELRAAARSELARDDDLEASA